MNGTRSNTPCGESEAPDPRFETISRLPLGGVTHVKWSPSGRFIAAGNTGGQFIIWDIRAESVVGSGREPFNAQVSCIAWSPDETQVAVGGSQSGAVSLWGRDGTDLVRILDEAHPETVHALAWGHGFLFSGTEDSFIRCWDQETGSLAGKTLVGELSNGRIGSREDGYYGHSNISSLELSPDKSLLATAGYRNETCIRTSRDLSAMRVVPLSCRGLANDAAWSPDGEHIAISGAGTVVRVFELRHLRQMRIIDTPAREFSGYVTYSADGRLVSVGPCYSDEPSILAEVSSGQTCAVLPGLSPVAFSPGAPLLAVCSCGRCILLRYAAEHLRTQYAETVETDDLGAGSPTVLLLHQDRDDQGLYRPATWFRQMCGIPSERLRQAARRKQLPKHGRGKRTVYNVEAAKQLWPEDFEGLDA